MALLHGMVDSLHTAIRAWRALPAAHVSEATPRLTQTATGAHPWGVATIDLKT
jgi:hypothetical protein